MDKEDPYTPQSEVPDDCGLRCQMVSGVMNVYTDDEALERNEPMTMTYPQLDEFLADQAVLTRLISDGPLYAPRVAIITVAVLGKNIWGRSPRPHHLGGNNG